MNGLTPRQARDLESQLRHALADLETSASTIRAALAQLHSSPTDPRSPAVAADTVRSGGRDYVEKTVHIHLDPD